MNKLIALHYSYTNYGCFQLINKWHQKRYSPVISANNVMVYCAYNLVICNGYLFEGTEYIDYVDGLLEIGRLTYSDSPFVQKKTRPNLEIVDVCIISETKNLTMEQVSTLNLVREIYNDAPVEDAKDIYTF